MRPNDHQRRNFAKLHEDIMRRGGRVDLTSSQPRTSTEPRAARLILHASINPDTITQYAVDKDLQESKISISFAGNEMTGTLDDKRETGSTEVLRLLQTVSRNAILAAGFIA